MAFGDIGSIKQLKAYINFERLVSWMIMNNYREQETNIYRYNLGDKVIARWNDGKLYPGQIHKVLTFDSYMVLFEDGLQKVVKVNHIEPNLNPVPRTELPFDDARIQRSIHESDICDLIINCVCGSICENGSFLVQCEHCLTWQHADCLDVETDADLFEAITCSSCFNPKGVRESCRYKYDHSWLKDATLPNLMPKKDEQIQVNDRVASVNFLLEGALKCVTVLKGLRAAIPLQNMKINSCEELKCWSKCWLTTDFEGLSSSKKTITPSVKPNTPSKVKNKSNKKQRSAKRDKKLSKCNFDLDSIDPCSSSNADDSNLSTININQVTPDQIDESKKKIESSSFPSKEILSTSSNSLDEICQKNLREHIETMLSLLKIRLEYFESRIDELEEWYGPDLDPNDIEANRTEFRVALKRVHSDLDTFKKIHILIQRLQSNTFD